MTNSINKLSIIVPIHNTPINDLKRCFESLANQTCKDFDLIAVNNRSFEYVNQYLNEIHDKNIFNKFIIVNENNLGVSNARNKGLDIVDTEYFSFADSDDTYDISFVSKVYEYLEKYNNIDLLIGNIEYHPQWKSQIKIFEDKIYSGDNDIIYIKESFFEFKNRRVKYNINVSPCAKVFRRETCKNIRFCNDVNFGEDQLYVLDVLNCVKNILVVKDIFYNYYQNEYSASRNALKNVNYDKYKVLWDCYYEKLQKEKSIENNKLNEFKLRLLNGFINRTCAANRNIGINESVTYLKEALTHKIMIDMLNNISVFNSSISFINSINVILLRCKMYYLYVIEKKLIYLLGLNKDKI